MVTSTPAGAAIRYSRIALVDALRDGRTRERKLAEQELKKLLRKKADG